MPDRFAFPLLALLAAGLVAVALVWPQGQGAPSPFASQPIAQAGPDAIKPGKPADPLAALAKKAAAQVLQRHPPP